MTVQEFECKICGLIESESAIRSSLEKTFPSLRWEEGDSSWDKIRVWGEGQKGDIDFIRIYRYESPGAFDLTVRLRVADGVDGEQEYLKIRQRLLDALGAHLWKPLKPQPVTLIKPDGRFPDAYEFESDLGIRDIEALLNDSEYGTWGTVFINRLSSETCLEGYYGVRIFGTRGNFRIEVGKRPSPDHSSIPWENVNEAVQNTILPAIGARRIRPAKTAPPPEVSIPKLIRILKTGPGWQQSTGAADALAEIGTEAREAVPALIEALRHQHNYVRCSAAKALGRMGPVALEAVPALLKSLWDNDREFHYGAVEALMQIGATEAAVPKLGLMLKTAKSPFRRQLAAISLGKIGGKAQAAIPELVDALCDADEGVRKRAAEALGKMGPAASVTIEALQNKLERNLKLLGEAREALEPGTKSGPES